MARRRVTRTEKGGDGDITALCGDFGLVPKAIAVRDIRARTHVYYTNVLGLPATIRVVSVGGVPHLTTHPDRYRPNNLENLPPC